MRPAAIFGVILLCLGILALAVPSITFFTHEPVVNTGFFQIDWQKPHTIFLNPIVGIVLMVLGVILMVAGRRSPTV